MLGDDLHVAVRSRAARGGSKTWLAPPWQSTAPPRRRPPSEPPKTSAHRPVAGVTSEKASSGPPWRPAASRSPGRRRRSAGPAARRRRCGRPARPGSSRCAWTTNCPPVGGAGWTAGWTAGVGLRVGRLGRRRRRCGRRLGVLVEVSRKMITNATMMSSTSPTTAPMTSIAVRSSPRSALSRAASRRVVATARWPPRWWAAAGRGGCGGGGSVSPPRPVSRTRVKVPVESSRPVYGATPGAAYGPGGGAYGPGPAGGWTDGWTSAGRPARRAGRPGCRALRAAVVEAGRSGSARGGGGRRPAGGDTGRDGLTVRHAVAGDRLRWRDGTAAALRRRARSGSRYVAGATGQGGCSGSTGGRWICWVGWSTSPGASVRAGSFPTVSGARCRATRDHGAPCPSRGPKRRGSKARAPRTARLRVVRRRQLPHRPQRRQEGGQEGQRHPDRADPHRRPAPRSSTRAPRR